MPLPRLHRLRSPSGEGGRNNVIVSGKCRALYPDTANALLRKLVQRDLVHAKQALRAADVISLSMPPSIKAWRAYVEHQAPDAQRPSIERAEGLRYSG